MTCRVKYGRSADILWAVQSLCPRSGPCRMDFDESLIVLGKHPHGVRLQTKTAILSSFCRGKCSQDWQITAGHEVPGLTMDSKTWWDRSDPKGYINLSRNEHWITRHHFFLIFPLPASPLSTLHKKIGDHSRNIIALTQQGSHAEQFTKTTPFTMYQFHFSRCNNSN